MTLLSIYGSMFSVAQGGYLPVFDTLKPIMTNFRVENATPTRVYFDTPLGPVTGLDYTDFIIQGRTITGVDTTSNYFTLSTSITFWETILIRKEGGNNDVVYDFRLQEIVNNVSEPVSSSDKYVEPGASGGGDSLGDPMGIEAAFTEASDNTVYHIKKGTYSAVNCVIGRSASLTSPAKFIGYDSSPEDNPSLTRSVGMSFDANVMPLLDGGSNSGWGIALDSRSGIILKNLQIQSYDVSGSISGTNASNIHIDNLYTDGGDRGIELDGNTANDSSGDNKVINSYVANNTGVALRVQNKSNLVKNTWVITSKIVNQDYYIAVYSGPTGHSQLVKDCYVYRFPTDSHTGHGIDFRTTEQTDPHEYSLIEDCEIYNIDQAVSFRHSRVKYNVARNILCDGSEGAAGNLVTFRDDCSYNIIENSTGLDVRVGINYRNNTGEEIPLEPQAGGHHNKVINCVIDGAGTLITENPIGDTILPSTYNEFINCTFLGSGSNLYTSYSTTQNYSSTNTIVNCVFDTTPQGITGTFTPTINNCNLYNVGTWGNAYIGNDGNINIDPDLNASYQPQAPFSSIQGARIDGVYYDKDGEERASLTTIGAVLHTDEEVVADPELVTDGSFDFNNTYWDVGTGSSITSNQATIISTAGSYTYLSQNNVMTAGLSYTVEFDVIATNGETLASNLDEIVWNTSTTGHKIQVITAPEARLMFKRRVGSTDTNITLDNISVKLA